MQKDDGDSGNDEPSEDSAPLPAFHVDASNNPPDYLLPAVAWNSRDSPQSANQVSPSDRLAKRVTQLTTHISCLEETSNRDNSHRIPPESKLIQEYTYFNCCFLLFLIKALVRKWVFMFSLRITFSETLWNLLQFGQ